MRDDRGTDSLRRGGQSTVEWVGAVAAMAGLALALATHAPGVARTLSASVDRVACAVGGGGAAHGGLCPGRSTRPAAARRPGPTAVTPGSRWVGATFRPRSAGGSAPDGFGFGFGGEDCVDAAGTPVCRGDDGRLRSPCDEAAPCDARLAVPVAAIPGVRCAPAPNELRDPGTRAGPHQLCGYRTPSGVGIIARCTRTVPAPGVAALPERCVDSGRDAYARATGSGIRRCLDGVGPKPAEPAVAPRQTTWTFTATCVTWGGGIYRCHTEVGTANDASGRRRPPTAAPAPAAYRCDSRSHPSVTGCEPTRTPNLDACALGDATAVRCVELGGEHHHCALAPRADACTATLAPEPGPPGRRRLRGGGGAPSPPTGPPRLVDLALARYLHSHGMAELALCDERAPAAARDNSLLHAFRSRRTAQVVGRDGRPVLTRVGAIGIGPGPRRGASRDGLDAVAPLATHVQLGGSRYPVALGPPNGRGAGPDGLLVVPDHDRGRGEALAYLDELRRRPRADRITLAQLTDVWRQRTRGLPSAVPRSPIDAALRFLPFPFELDFARDPQVVGRPGSDVALRRTEHFFDDLAMRLGPVDLFSDDGRTAFTRTIFATARMRGLVPRFWRTAHDPDPRRRVSAQEEAREAERQRVRYAQRIADWAATQPPPTCSALPAAPRDPEEGPGRGGVGARLCRWLGSAISAP